MTTHCFLQCPKGMRIQHCVYPSASDDVGAFATCPNQRGGVKACKTLLAALILNVIVIYFSAFLILLYFLSRYRETKTTAMACQGPTIFRASKYPGHPSYPVSIIRGESDRFLSQGATVFDYGSYNVEFRATNHSP